MFTKSKKTVTEQEALLKLSALCSQAEHSSGEMREKMRRWALPPDVSERVLNRLIDECFVDDERYARFFVRDKIRFDRWGRRKIDQALYRKGIDSSIRSRVLDAVPVSEYESVLRELLAAKRRTVKASSDYELCGKLVRFAVSRGFDMDIVRRCVSSADDYDLCSADDTGDYE